MPASLCADQITSRQRSSPKSAKMHQQKRSPCGSFYTRERARQPSRGASSYNLQATTTNTSATRSSPTPVTTSSSAFTTSVNPNASLPVDSTNNAQKYSKSAKSTEQRPLQVALENVKKWPLWVPLLLLLAIVFLPVLIFIIFSGSSPSIINVPTEFWNKTLSPQFMSILKNNPKLFLIEPYFLSKLFRLNGTKDEEEGELKWNEFRWRFGLPHGEHSKDSQFEWKSNVLSVGVFADNVISAQGFLNESSEIVPILNSCNNSSICDSHIYLPSLSLHLVIFQRKQHFLWIGSSPFASGEMQSRYFNHTYEQIYDQFSLVYIDGIQVPDDIGHFLGQLHTARYLHCEPALKETVKVSSKQAQSIERAIIGIKGLMQRMQMEAWIACGTLLAWKRECDFFAHTDDVDFVTWSKYLILPEKEFAAYLRSVAPQFGLSLMRRFGEPTATMEYTLKEPIAEQRADLFFMYPNGTHFLMPIHMIPEYAYAIYPQHKLCSVELIGYKLLAPCDPLKIVEAEYGPNWIVPKTSYSYVNDPFNVGPHLKYNFSGTQYILYDEYYNWWNLFAYFPWN